MIKVCVCGGGNLGHVAAGILAAKGVAEVSLLTRQPHRWQQELTIHTPDGTHQKGRLKCISADASRVVSDADIVLLCLPGFSIHSVLQQVKPCLKLGAAVGSVVASSGFFFEALEMLSHDTPLFGFQRVPFIARTEVYGQSATLLGYKSSLSVAIEQCNDKEALRSVIEQLFLTPTILLDNYYEVSLTNSNPLLHPARLFTMWKDWEEGKTYPEQPFFYEEWTDEASQMLIDMDEEFQQILAKLPVRKGSIPTILDYYESTDASSLTRKLRSIEAFKGIRSPMRKTNNGYVPDFTSRYFTEDFPYGLMIIYREALKTGVNTPVIKKVLQWGMLRQFNPEGSVLRRQQLRMLEILKEVDRICQKHAIPYWLSSGTLIGAMRHNGFIPWDDDLDIEMMRTDYLRLIKLLPAELPEWLALQDGESDPNYFSCYAKVRDRRSYISEVNDYDRLWKERGIYIDILPVERHPIWMQKLSEKTIGHMYKVWRTSTDDRRSMRKVRWIYQLNQRFVYPLFRLLARILPDETITSAMGIPFHNPRYANEIFPLTTHRFEDAEFPVPGQTDAHLRHIYGDYMQLPDLTKLSPHVSRIEFLS